MFCGKCGTQNSESARFCKACGAPMEPIPGRPPLGSPPEGSGAAGAAASSRNRKVGMAAVGIGAAVIVIAVVFALFGGRSYKSTINTFMDSVLSGDATEIVDLIPKQLIDELIEESGYSKKEIIDELEDMCEEVELSIGMATAFLGDSMKITYKVTEAEDVSNKALRELKEEYEEFDVTVRAAKNVDVELSVKADGYDSSNTITIPVIKVGRAWYLDVYSLAEIL